MNISTVLRTLLTTSLVVATPAVFAHAGHTESGLLAGFAHPFMGLDHIIVMFAIGLWAARLGGKAVVAVPMAFVTTMILACALTVIGVNVPFIEQGIITSVIFLGLLLAVSSRFSTSIGSALVAVFAFFHGAAHGIEMPADVSGSLYVIGFASASALLHATGVLFNTLLPANSSVIIHRISGALIALIGLSMAFG